MLMPRLHKTQPRPRTVREPVLRADRKSFPLDPEIVKRLNPKGELNWKYGGFVNKNSVLPFDETDVTQKRSLEVTEQPTSAIKPN